MSFMNYSSNVILAKARAMYGNCLKTQNYTELLACHSVSEVASYLKNRTAYASVLSDINEATIHRGYLETLLKRKIFNDFTSLMRYDMTVGMHMSDYLIQRAEMEQIIRCLQMMTAGRSEEFLFSLPLFFSTHTKLDLIKMAHAKNYDQLLEALAGSPYKELLEPMRPEKGKEIPITQIENALYSRVVKTLYGLIDHTSGSVRKELIHLCGSQVDTESMIRIFRMKKYFHASADEIRPNLLPSGRCISPKMWERMLHAETAEEVLEIYYTTSIGRRIPENQRLYYYDLHHRAPYYNARHYIHYSINPMVVLISYSIITDIELDDIVNIIEGIRYALPTEQIKPMLVLANH